MKDAYTEPRRVTEGCTHLPVMRCKCDVPFYLRESTPVEQERADTYAEAGTRKHKPIKREV